jgi:hypothetical protein
LALCIVANFPAGRWLRPAETGNERFVQPVVDHFGQQILSEIIQRAIDQAAVKLYPNGTAHTRNRQVHVVVSAILKHAGVGGMRRRWRVTRMWSQVRKESQRATLPPVEKLWKRRSAGAKQLTRKVS